MRVPLDQKSSIPSALDSKHHSFMPINRYIKSETKCYLVKEKPPLSIFWCSWRLSLIGLLIFLIAGCTPSSGDFGVWNTFIDSLITLTKSEYFWYALGIGLLAQTVDGALGMAYGLTSNSFLLSIGATPAAASGAVHVAEIFTTAASGTAHLRFKNVDKPLLIKIVFPGVLGGILGVLLITSVNTQLLKPLVACYLFVMGVIILLKAFKKILPTPPNRLKHLKKLALGGGFLDAVGGGGWGPIVTSSLIGQGNCPRKTIGTVNAAEFFIALVTGISFIFLGAIEHWTLVCGLIVGGLFAAPFAAFLTSRMNPRALLTVVGLLIMTLSLITLKPYLIA